MGIFDFIFGNKKKGEQECLERERKAELQRKENDQKTSISHDTLKPFTFSSNQHLRYENNSPVHGLQNCVRTISVEVNKNGCNGYKLNPGDGYIVKVFNNDLNRPMMADKPMRIHSQSATFVELRGYSVIAQTPFGWQEHDLSDYGLTVYYENGNVSKCVLHMYDRNIRIEYMKKENLTQNKTTINTTVNNQLTETELFVQEALSQFSLGNDGDEVYHPLYKAWRSFQRNPSQLKHIIDCGKYGMGLMIFLSYGTISDIDIKQQISSIAYLFLSKEIQKNPNSINLYKNRLILMLSNHEAFEYTVSSVVNSGKDFMDRSMSPFEARDAMYKMEFSDLSKGPQLLSVEILAQKFIELKNKISSGFFGPNENNLTIIDQGNSLHIEILNYLEDKVIDNEDIDF